MYARATRNVIAPQPQPPPPKQKNAFREVETLKIYKKLRSRCDARHMKTQGKESVSSRGLLRSPSHLHRFYIEIKSIELPIKSPFSTAVWAAFKTLLTPHLIHTDSQLMHRESATEIG